MPESQTWTTERIARLVALALLTIACLQIILPFLGALTWAAIIAITVWPAFVWLSGRLGSRPVLAAGLCARITRVFAADLGPSYALDGNRLPLCPELVRWKDLPDLVAGLPQGVFAATRP